MASTRSVLVYGGAGALGNAAVRNFVKSGYRVISVDLVANEEAAFNVLVTASDSWSEQARKISEQVSKHIGNDKLKAIVCVAGGWAGGNAAHEDLIKNTELMYKQSVWTSVISAQLAARFIDTDGMLVLTGALPALEGTPTMVGYGMAKCAVHQLIKSLAQPGSGLPETCKVLGILPITLDTPMNRKFMPSADHSTWTPLETLVRKIISWTEEDRSLPSGTLVKVATTAGETKFIPIE